MTPAEQRVRELVDRWLASLELHLRYASLSDEAYARVQPWPPHARPARWIVELAHARAADLKHHVEARRAAGDAGFAEAIELMGFLSNLVGAQDVARFIPLADAARENAAALAGASQVVAPAAPAAIAAAPAAEPAGSEAAADAEVVVFASSRTDDGEGDDDALVEGADAATDPTETSELLADRSSIAGVEAEAEIEAEAEAEAEAESEAEIDADAEVDSDVDVGAEIDVGFEPVPAADDAVPTPADGDLEVEEARADSLDASGAPTADGIVVEETTAEVVEAAADVADAMPDEPTERHGIDAAVPHEPTIEATVGNVPSTGSAASGATATSAADAGPAPAVPEPPLPDVRVAAPVPVVERAPTEASGRFPGLKAAPPLPPPPVTPPPFVTSAPLTLAALEARIATPRSATRPGGVPRWATPAQKSTPAAESPADVTPVTPPAAPPAPALASAHTPAPAPAPAAARSPVPPVLSAADATGIRRVAIDGSATGLHRLARDTAATGLHRTPPGTGATGLHRAPGASGLYRAPLDAAATARHRALLDTDPTGRHRAPVDAAASGLQRAPGADLALTGTRQMPRLDAATLPASPEPAATPSRPPPVLDAPRAPGRGGRKDKRGRNGGNSHGASANGAGHGAKGGAESLVVADAVRLLKWGKEWYELAEAIARMAGRPPVGEVRKLLRAHKADIERESRS